VPGTCTPSISRPRAKNVIHVVQLTGTPGERETRAKGAVVFLLVRINQTGKPFQAVDPF